MADKLNTKLNFSIAQVGDMTQINPLISKIRVRIFYTGLNRNLTYISEEFADKLLKTLPYTPVGGLWDAAGGDFEDHGTDRNQFSAFGVVPENPNVQWEDHLDNDGVLRKYACCDVFLWTARYEAAREIPDKSQSMELFIDSVEGDWKRDGATQYFEFTDGCFLGLTALGDEVEPCFEGAAFYNLNDTGKLISELKNYNFSATNELIGGTEMELENEVLEPVENEAEEVVETVETEEVVEVAAEAEAEAEEATEYVEEATEEVVETTEEVEETVEVAAETEETTGEDEENNFAKKDEEEDEEEKEEEDKEKEDEEDEFECGKKKKDEFALLEEKISALESEIEGYKTQIEELTSYKLSIEKEEKASLVNKYSEVLSEEVVEKFMEKIDTYSFDALKAEIALEVVNANEEALFNKGETKEVVTSIETKAHLSGAAKLMSKYYKD